MFSWVERQAALGPRRPGSPAGIANEDLLFAELKRLGLHRVRREPVPVTYWNPSEAEFSVEGRRIECFPIPFAKFTPAAGVEAPLAFASPKALSAKKDWRGKIIVTEVSFPDLNPSLLLALAFGAHDPENTLRDLKHPATWIRLGWHLYGWAAKQGAVGFVGILKDQPGGSCRMYAPYGFREKDILDKTLPGVWVGRDAGAELVAAAKSGKQARLLVRGTQTSVVSHNIVGEIEGETGEAVVLSSHHDSPFTSPVEDGTGVAVVLALAEKLSKLPQLRRKIIVLFTSGHFYGSLGTRSFIQSNREGLSKIALEISIEHVALEAAEDAAGKLIATGLSEPAGFFVPFNRALRETTLEAVRRWDLRRSLVLPAEGPLGDFPPTDGGDWYEAGVPLINFISNPVYLLTDDDAFRWVDKSRLPSVASCFLDLIRVLDSIPAETLRRTDYPMRLRMMKALKHLIRAKTTAFGIRN